MMDMAMQDDPYIDLQWAFREEQERTRLVQHEAWMQGWRAGSRIGGTPTSPYAREK